MTDLPTEPDIRMEMSSKPRLLAAARAMVSNVAQRIGFNEVECGQISLAVDEALCNIINHGYDRKPDGRIWLNVWVLDSASGGMKNLEGMKIVLEDLARQIEPDLIRGRDLDDIKPGGLGVFIIREVMDQVEYERRDEGGMRLTMVKQLPDETSGDCDDAAVCRESESA